MPAEFPAHASPAINPLALSNDTKSASTTPPDHHKTPEHPRRIVSNLDLGGLNDPSAQQAHPALVTPVTVGASNPLVSGQRHDRDPHDVAAAAAASDSAAKTSAAASAGVDTDENTPSDPLSLTDPSSTSADTLTEQPQLLQELPHVSCQVRARVPTTTGTEMWLHLYHNDADDKEHLAIVFGPHIRSRSLDAERPGETERDRMIRGAYVGTLYPGRVSSRVDQLRRDAGVAPSGLMAMPGSPSGGAGGAATLSGRSSSVSSSQLSVSAPDDSSVETGSGSGDYFQASYPSHLGPPLVRIHSECYTGETVWSARCDCGEQLNEAGRLMSAPIPSPQTTPDSEASGLHSQLQQLGAAVSGAEAGGGGQKLPACGGVIVYLRQEGRGIGLLSKLKAYNLQDLGHDTMEANLLLRHPGDARSYGLATAMLLDLGLGGERGIKLLTNNPEKVRAVEGPNREVKVVQRVPMIPLAWKTGGKEGVHGPEVEKYISTKIEKFKHMFSG